MTTSHLKGHGLAVTESNRKITPHDMYLSIRQASVFTGLDEVNINKLIVMAKPCYYSKGQFIFLEGDIINHYYVILQGRVVAMKQTLFGKDVIVRILRPGDTIGDVAIIDGEPICVSAQAREDSILLSFIRKDYLRFILENPIVALNMITTVGQRLKATQDRFMEMATYEVEQRVINVLSELFVQFGTVVTLTHQEVAEMSGTTRETCTRVIKRLEKLGIITSLRGRIVLIDRNNLKLLSEVRSITSPDDQRLKV